MGYSPWGRKELDMIERLTLIFLSSHCSSCLPLKPSHHFEFGFQYLCNFPFWLGSISVHLCASLSAWNKQGSMSSFFILRSGLKV